MKINLTQLLRMASDCFQYLTYLLWTSHVDNWLAELYSKLKQLAFAVALVLNGFILEKNTRGIQNTRFCVVGRVEREQCDHTA